MTNRATIVLDIGKTLSKASLWTPAGRLIAKRSRLNVPQNDGPYAALDAAGIESWLKTVLIEFASLADVGHLIPVSHGAGAAIIRDRKLQLPPLDYEFAIPDAVRRRYDALRDPFEITGSPPLPHGLNLGAQLYYLQTLYPNAFGEGSQILTWAQYWSWLMSGVACTEVTSLACHTDLWRPSNNTFSPLTIAQGWARLMAPLRRAGDALGPLTAAWAAETGLPSDVTVHCGLHDSNAALLAARGFAEIADLEATVLSTGTWFVCMRTPASTIDVPALAQDRDCLVNVDVFHRLIPSARFMGGREIELLSGIDSRRIDLKPDQPQILSALKRAVIHGAMVLPTLAPSTGPFPRGEFRWIGMPANEWERRAAVCLYCALLAEVSLDLIGARGTLLIEGRFADSDTFVRALATLRRDMRMYTGNTHSDVSYGALRLLIPGLSPPGGLKAIPPLDTDLSQYRAEWRRLTGVFTECVTNTEMSPWSCAGDGGRSPGVDFQE